MVEKNQTPRFWKEEQLSEHLRETMLNSIADNLPEAVLYQCSWDAQGKLNFHQLSAGTAKLLGIPAYELMREPSRFLGCFPPGRAEEWRKGMASAARESRAFLFETWIVSAASEKRWVQFRSMPHPMGGHEFYHDGLMLDVTGQKETHEQLCRVAERLQEAQRLACLGTWELDVATGKIAWSNQVYDIFGLERGMPAPDLEAHKAFLSENSYRLLRETLEQALEWGKPFELELEFLKANGTTGYMLVHGEPVLDEGGAAKRLVGTALDITSRKLADRNEASMARLESVGQLAAGIAHDFNNYLATLGLGFELVRSMQNGELEEEFKVIKATLGAAKRLTNQLLTLAKGGRPVKTQLDLVQMLKETADFVMRGSMVECLWSIQPGLPLVHADADQMQQVFSNILINARQAMENQGKVAIELRVEQVGIGNRLSLEPGNYIGIGIEDQGCGILPEHMEKIYEPYFSTKPSGSGLGMAVVYRILQSHRGGILCESIPGKGTRFEIYLPVDPASLQTAEGNAKQSVEGAVPTGHRILILDDEPFMLKCLGQYLRKLGYEVGEAKVGEECLELYERAKSSGHPFDALILDITIKGGMGGVETLAELRKRHRNVKAVASSGYSKDGILSHYEEYGFAAALPKPYSVESLSEVLREIIGQKPGPAGADGKT
jgi:signal transduction histidine kinase/ActR/RegA family two-component response regulator